MLINCPQCGAEVLHRPGHPCRHCGQPLPEQAQSALEQVVNDLATDPAHYPATVETTASPAAPRNFAWQPGEEPQPERTPAIDPAILAFYRRLLELTPRATVTKTLVAANCLLFLAMAISSQSFFLPSSETLVAWGSNSGPKTLAGEYWRLVSCMFLHIGVIHLAVNMWGLWQLGQFVERLVGNVGFLLLYMVSGIAGSLASVFWRPEVNSAGASGALFGIFGTLMGFLVLRRNSIPRRILGELRKSVVSVLLINLAIGFSATGIDTAAHLGGLAAGFLGGLVLSQRLDRATGLSRGAHNLVLGTLAMAGVLIALMWAPPVPTDWIAEFTRFEELQRQVIDDFNDLRKKSLDGRVDTAAYLTALDERVIEPWRAQRQRFESFTQIPAELRPRVQLVQRYLTIRERTWELLRQASVPNSEVDLKELEDNQRQLNAVMDEINAWKP